MPRYLDPKNDLIYYYLFGKNPDLAVNYTREIIHGHEIVMIELSKFCPQIMNNRKQAALWLHFLKEIDNISILPKEFQENEYINKAAEICEVWRYTDKQMDGYERYWDGIRVQKSLWKDVM